MKAGYPDDRIATYDSMPPYATWREIGHGENATDRPHGHLIALRPLPGVVWSRLQERAADLERRNVRSTLILWTDLVSRVEATRFARHSLAAGFDAVIPRAQINVESIRVQVTQAAGVEVALERWLNAVGFPVDAAVGGDLRTMFRGASSSWTLAGHLRALGQAPDYLRTRFRRAGMRESGRWFALFRVMRIVLRLQEHPQEPLALAAEALGFHDGAALRARLRAVLGTNTTTIRRQLGWKWALHSGLCRGRALS